MRKVKLIVMSVGLVLSMVLVGHFVLGKIVGNNSTDNEVKITRTVSTSIDYQALLQNFDSYTIDRTETTILIEADKRVSLNPSELDNLSLDDNDETTNIHYSYEYDLEKGLIYMTITFTELNEVAESETLVGIPFYDPSGTLDVMFNIGGEIVLMSEMINLSIIDQCGLFSKIVKAVVAVVVATAGAGLGVVVAAGAAAGAVTGGVAGGIISYQETGVVEPWAVLTGVVAGAAIGALVGYAVGSIMGVNGVAVNAKFGQGSFKTAQESIDYHFKTHGARVGVKNATEYVTKAKDFAQMVVKNNIKSVRAVEGATQGVMRYEANGYFIHMAMNAKEIIIVTFGLI